MFFYFIPTDAAGTNCPPELLAEYQLDAVVDDPVVAPSRRGGPGGRPGIVVVDRELSESPIVYNAERQTWRQSLNTDAWVGHFGKTPPRLADLRRRDALPGHAVRLSNGERALIPIARRYAEHAGQLVRAVALPQSLGRDPESGQWVPRDVVARYRPLWNLLRGYLDAMESALRAAPVDPGESVFFDYPEIHDLIVAAFTANYRIAHDEIEVLGIYDQSLQRRVIDALTDEKTLDAWIKKKQPAATSVGSISNDGPDQSTPAGN